MPGAFVVAYRMLGSVSEAEQVVQEAFLRLHRTLQEGERLESSRAYLSPVVTRLCIDQLRSARARRERYVGEWLPGPRWSRAPTRTRPDGWRWRIRCRWLSSLPTGRSRRCVRWSTPTSCGTWGRLPTSARCCMTAGNQRTARGISRFHSLRCSCDPRPGSAGRRHPRCSGVPRPAARRGDRRSV
jgi:hypothetical protein